MTQLYLDCDGVLADFDTGAKAILGLHPRDFEARHGLGQFWKRLAGARDFYATLPPLPDAHVLFEAVRPLNPIILTGLPQGRWAEPQKVRWAAEHFPGAPIICCLARDKAKHARAGDILIDDTLKYRHLWEEADGLFIHHTSAEESLAALKALRPDLLPGG
jgi:hypothetical protein